MTTGNLSLMQQTQNGSPKQGQPGPAEACRTALHADATTSGPLMGLWYAEIRSEHESHAIQPTAKHRL